MPVPNHQKQQMGMQNFDMNNPMMNQMMMMQPNMFFNQDGGAPMMPNQMMS